MSLAPVVGCYELTAGDEAGRARFVADLAQVNRVLAENGLPRHDEPPALPAYSFRVALTHLGTTWIHHLRRLQAHALQDPAWKHAPCTDDDEPWLDEAVDLELTVYLRSHLILHADTAGYYAPLDFPDVLYGAPGGDMLGSSHRLLAELRQLAPYLGVTLDAAGDLPDAEAERVARTPDHDAAFREKAAWLLLFECARHSVALGALIAFT